MSFIYERLHYIYVEQGKSVNIFRAVLASEPTELLDFTKRFEAVEKFSSLAEANDLVASYKRIRNILKQTQDSTATQFDETLAVEPAERSLAQVIKQEARAITSLYADKDYFAILEILVKTKPMLDKFFDQIMVMVKDDTIRCNRLALLRKLQKLFTLVADLSWLL